MNKPPEQEKPPWRPWAFAGQSPLGKGNTSIVREHRFANVYQPQKNENSQRAKHVTFSKTTNLLHPRNQNLDQNNNHEKRNLQVSQQLMNHFKPKPPAKLTPQQTNLSETHSSYRTPGKQRPIPIRHSGYRTIVNQKDENNNVVVYEKASSWKLPQVFHPIGSDNVSKIYDMRHKILSGKYVSNTDISELKYSLKSSKAEIQPELKDRLPDNYKSHKRIARKLLFCDKGIVYLPTPHTPPPEFNSFGTPADLRISLSNSDTPEYRGRRRFFFDFTGFLDPDIKLYLEGRSRLVIRGDRPDRYEKMAMKITDYIDLPKDLPVDNLRIVRDVFGTLIVEEAWKFL